MRTTALLILALAAVSCGPGPGELDESGLIAGDDDMSAFIRASQLYFRGNLSRARDEYNIIIYRYSGSPLIDDASLAVRRIDQDLGSYTVEDSGSVAARGVEIAVVGLPANSARVSRVVSALSASGWTAWAVQDIGAPDITVVLYPDGLESEASIAGDSLHSWLTSPASVPVQPGGQMMDAIVPDHEGLVVVIGGDAEVSARAPSNGSGGL